jgi:mono/diheme cytochrome c family protein
MKSFFKRWWWAIKQVLIFFAVVIGILVVALAVVINAPDRVRAALKKIGRAGEIASAALPPALPAATRIEKAYWLPQNWSARDRYWFHHATQGTATFPIPYDWFVSLERAQISLFDSPGLLMDQDYLGRFGFIPSPPKFDGNAAEFGYSSGASPGSGDGAEPYRLDEYPDNPDGLPVGFAKLKSGDEPATGERYETQIGFTCAACHTGHIEYNNVSIRFDGGPAMIDLSKLESTVGLAIAYTLIDPFRFRRFAARVSDRVKKTGGQLPTNSTLKKELKVVFDKLLLERNWQTEILARGNMKPTDEVYGEGFGRLDALNRIGNQVFFSDLLPNDAKELPKELAGNFWRQDAPVSFPPIWDVPWFLWAQYDGSILNPPVRNAGEALGVKAKLNFPLHADPKNSPKNPLFRSSIQLTNLFSFERLLSGADPFTADKPGDSPKFKGLLAPKWDDVAKIFKDDAAWQINAAKAAKGREHYRKHCFECHRGPVNDPEFDKQWPSESFWQEENPDRRARNEMNWFKIGDERFFNVVQKPVTVMGTDPQQSRVLTERKVYLPPYLSPYRSINPIADLNEKWKCGLPKDDGLNASFALALMAVVDRTIDQWFIDNPTSPELEARMRDKTRPNCQNPRVFRGIPGEPSIPGEAPISGEAPIVVAVPHYRARPLDGVWATAPYLHNGAVPTLHHMLVPQNMRPQAFCVGSRQFDPISVGLAVSVNPSADPKDVSCATGLTKFDTTQPGNSKLGHSFEGTETDTKKLPAGVIGPSLSDTERDELIEYLKAL